MVRMMAVRMVMRTQRRRRRRRMVLVGGLLAFGAYKLSKRDVKRVEEHTGQKGEELTDEQLEQAMDELGIEGEDLTAEEAAMAFAGTMVGLALSLGIVVNAVAGTVEGPSLEALVEEPPGLLHQTFLVLLAAMFLWSLLRRGVRKFVGEIFHGLGNGRG